MNDAIFLNFPAWLQDEMRRCGDRFADEEARMAYVIGLSRRNVQEQTGGPFAAAVFERGSGKLLSMGVNLVMRSNCSHAHAEMIAIAFAEQRLGSYTLRVDGEAEYELVTSCEPCAMCFGAIPWSGVTRVVSGAKDADARIIGFDEGPKPRDWAEALRDRGIEVSEGVCREAAAAVLEWYAESGGEIYNGNGAP